MTNLLDLMTAILAMNAYDQGCAQGIMGIAARRRA